MRVRYKNLSHSIQIIFLKISSINSNARASGSRTIVPTQIDIPVYTHISIETKPKVNVVWANKYI